MYFNDCCWGGDVVSDLLLPIVSEGRTEIEHQQEDWGWFIWCKEGKIRLATDIYCEDQAEGRFQILLTSRKPGFLLGESVVDTPELSRLADEVSEAILKWTGSAPQREAQ